MEVRAAMGARVSLCTIASDLPLGSAERDIAVPHGRTVGGASQSVSARNRTRTWRYAPRRHRASGLCIPASDRISEPQSATPQCLTGASSKARASPFRLASNRKMEVRAATTARVSLCMLASALPPIRRLVTARRRGAHGRHRGEEDRVGRCRRSTTSSRGGDCGDGPRRT